MRAWLVLVAVCACGKVPPPTPSDANNGSFNIMLADTNVFIRRGETQMITVRALRDASFTADIDVAVSGLPTGVTADPLTLQDPTPQAMLVLHASATATEGAASVMVHGDSGGVSAAAPLAMLVGGAPGTLDESFATGGKFTTQLGTNGLVGRGLAIASDGGILVAGVNVGMSQTVVVKVTPSGMLDASFGAGGIVTTGAGAFAEGIAITQSGGKIIVAGVANGNGTSDDNFGVFQYTASGALDTTFGSSGVATNDPGTGSFAEYHSVVTMADGSIVATGTVFGSTTTGHEHLFSPSGTFNTTYDFSESGVSFQASLMQPDSKLVAVGSVSGDTLIGRYNVNGGRDSGFGTGGITITDFGSLNATLDGVLLLTGGKLLGVGNNGTNVIILRYNANGSLDLTFGTNGVVTTAAAITTLSPNAAVLDTSGKILYVGRTGTTPVPSVARFNADGSVDTTFGVGGIAALDFGIAGTNQKTGGFGIATDSAGRIVISGEVGASGSQQLIVARLWP